LPSFIIIGAILGRLEEVLKLPKAARVNLVIAATTRSEDVGRIMTRFQWLSPQRVIFTNIASEMAKWVLPVD
jgi:flagellar biosynthesis GTPase FlhF